MRLSETIIIYLATGAPFSVSYFLHKRGSEHTVPGLLTAVAAGLLWPLMALRVLVAEYTQPKPTPLTDSVPRKHEEKIQHTKRQLLASLRVLYQLVKSAADTRTKEFERVAFVLNDSVETYVGLASAVEESSAGLSTNGPSMELFRIAGRKGDDLMLATKCAHRRNIARIIEHHSRARVQLIHGLADLYDAVECVAPLKSANGLADERMRLESVKLYKYAIDLLLLMGDHEAAIRITELVNRERTWLQALELTELRPESPHDNGEELCTTNTAHPSLEPLSNEATMAQG